MSTIRIGTRASRLAVIQAQQLADAVARACPGAQVELVTMKTTGDKILDRTLDQIGGKGLFVKELDAALLDGRVDFTGHSLKDLPLALAPRLPLVAVSRRADPRDVLVLPQGTRGWEPAHSSGPVGCASLRRALQLKALWPGLAVEPVRGNVLTRLEKLDRGDYAALVLAAAGLDRLGLAGRIFRYFTTQEILPAAGQGILAVQARVGTDTACLAGFHDRAAWACAQAERAFVQALDGGCSSPVAAYGALDGDTLTLTGMNLSGDRGSITGPADRAEELGQTLAARLGRGAENGGERQ